MNNCQADPKRLFFRLTILLMILLVGQASFAHVIVGELEKMSKTDTALLYLKTGYTHILPLGLDHILFVLSLYLLSPKIKPVLWQATAFTVAHSITLGLAMYHIISPSPRIIEPVIALSIIYVALENIFSPSLKKSRIGIVFLFGLVHGMGFASALGQLGLPQNAYLSSLVMFNVGVELGQLTVIIAAFYLFGKWFGEKSYYRKAIVVPISIVIALVAGYWTVERVLLISSSSPDQQRIVSEVFADSLVAHYSEPPAIRANEAEITFWKNRIDPKNPGFTNEFKYASAMAANFNLTGDINKLLISDSLLKTIDSVYDHKEAGPLLSLAAHAISRHRFGDADSLLGKAKSIGLKNYESLITSFDVDFELGRYLSAEGALKKIASSNDYGYYFRLSKLAHYNGEPDNAITAMLKAASLSDNDRVLKLAALSNAADLYLHNDQPLKAADLYRECIGSNPADMHSMMGIGWIALIHDKNYSLAGRIFNFVRKCTKLPDPVYKQVQLAIAENDLISAKKYALEFDSLTGDPQHGNMYNKYLIDLYTGILKEPLMAETIASRELQNRKTPQTYAWYVWSLYCNDKKAEAYKVYTEKVSGKPLEGPELYWMGKLMQGLGKDNTAKEYFKAAVKNRYDLGPEKIREMEKDL